LRGAKKGAQQDNRPRGPIKERSVGRSYALDDLEGDEAIELDAIAAGELADAPDSADATDTPDTPDEQNDE
jgi:hypothetical protein